MLRMQDQLSFACSTGRNRSVNLEPMLHDPSCKNIPPVSPRALSANSQTSIEVTAQNRNLNIQAVREIKPSHGASHFVAIVAQKVCFFCLAQHLGVMSLKTIRSCSNKSQCLILPPFFCFPRLFAAEGHDYLYSGPSPAVRGLLTVLILARLQMCKVQSVLGVRMGG